MTVKLTYRELQRISSRELLKRLGDDIALVHVDGQAIFKVKVVSEKDLTLDSQRNSLKTGVAHDSQATGIENNASTLTVKPTKQDLQAMIHKIEGKPLDAVSPSIQREGYGKIDIPWYDSAKHTSGDTVRMVDPKTKEIKVVTL